MPKELSYHTLTIINEDLVILIGGSPNGYVGQNQTYLFHLNNNTIEDGPQLLLPRYGHSSGIITDKSTGLDYIVACGGFAIFSIVPLKTCEYLSVKELDQWKTATFLFPHENAGLFGHRSVTIDGEMFVIGGVYLTSEESVLDDRVYKLSLNGI